jgi:hypothetical protein
VGGLLGGVQGGTQTQTGHGAMDFLLNTAAVGNYMFGDKKLPEGYWENW